MASVLVLCDIFENEGAVRAGFRNEFGEDVANGVGIGDETRMAVEDVFAKHGRVGGPGRARGVIFGGDWSGALEIVARGG